MHWGVRLPKQRPAGFLGLCQREMGANVVSTAMPGTRSRGSHADVPERCQSSCPTLGIEATCETFQQLHGEPWGHAWQKARKGTPQAQSRFLHRQGLSPVPPGGQVPLHVRGPDPSPGTRSCTRPRLPKGWQERSPGQRLAGHHPLAKPTHPLSRRTIGAHTFSPRPRGLTCSTLAQVICSAGP